jgi:hypothetical protein
MGLDTARGSVYIIPEVLLDDDLDAAGVTRIHHDVGTALGGTITYTKADENDKWFYNKSISITTDDELIIPTGVSSSQYTDGSAIIAAGDKVRLLYVRHTGETVAGTKTNLRLYITLDGVDPASQNDALVLDKGESMIIKPSNCQVGNLHSAAESGGPVIVEVLGIADDIG